jgi:large subunit ribosomal protein L9
MKVILREDIKNLGDIGSVVEVADGYGRNYLIPKNLAVEANPKNIKKVEHEKNIILQKIQKLKKSAEEFAGNLSDKTLTIEAQAGEDDKLFGSVTSKDIAEALSKQGVEVDKRKIIMPDEPIKRVGSYDIQIKVHPEVTANIKIDVQPMSKTESAENA